MTVLTLDPSLEPVRADERRYPTPTQRDAVAQACLSPGATKYDWRSNTTTVTEEVYRSSLPDEAGLFHANYLGYLSGTFAVHHSIVVAPHHFWYSVMCEIAQAVVSRPDAHRPMFTRDPAGKIEIVVPCSADDDLLRMDAIHDEMVGLVPVDTSLFLPEFSTTTEMSRLATLAAFLETCTPYYSYSMYLCGHPRVRLAGTPVDWAMMAGRLDALADEFESVDSPVAPWIRGTVAPTVSKLREAYEGGNEEWFRTMFTERRCGSGGQVVIDGWFSRLFMDQSMSLRQLCNFPTHITRVPYKVTGGKVDRNWNLCFGLFHSDPDADGFMVPEYGWVQVEKLRESKLMPPRPGSDGITMIRVGAQPRKLEGRWPVEEPTIDTSDG